MKSRSISVGVPRGLRAPASSRMCISGVCNHWFGAGGTRSLCPLCFWHSPCTSKRTSLCLITPRLAYSCLLPSDIWITSLMKPLNSLQLQVPSGGTKRRGLLHVWMVSQSSVIIRFEKLNLQKVCASLVDFHFRCCQLKGIWTNQYLSVFSHIESWLLEKRGLQHTQPIPLALALGQFCPCARVGTCPLPSPTIREATWDVIWTERAKSTSLFFLFFTPRLPQNQ